MNKNKIILSALAISIATPALVQVSSVEAADASFKDVPQDLWSYTIIQEMKSKGIINGFADNIFKPYQTITREHVAVLFSRSLDLKAVKPAVTFKDVPSNYIYYDAIKKVQQAGIFDGKNGYFNPKEPLTRAQMAKILTVAFDLKVKGETDLADTKDHWSRDYVRALYSNGVTTGSNGNFNPEDLVQRQHYAVFLHRALNLEKPELIDPEIPSEPSEPVPTEPTNVGEKLALLAKENPDLFLDNKPFDDISFELNPIASVMYLEGGAAVHQTNLKFQTGFLPFYNNSIVLKSEGYQNPTERLGDQEFLFDATGANEGTFNYDFRSEDANYLAKEWLKIGFPELTSLIPEIDKKVKEARVEENSDVWWPGNGEFFYIGDYEIRMGVTSFLESMAIEIYKK
ncbi:S-layer homology domain-containing protein [Peribacillus loiseleuriae]|uniref:S-layer homology domain-containing protein n=1 Tax=Peribacillus loiseleuriae TaxID=1679170 RepID=UPI003CFC763D